MSVKPRNVNAIRARQRNGGPMKHRNAPRGGQRNEQADLLAEAADEKCCNACGAPLVLMRKGLLPEHYACVNVDCDV